MKVTKIVSNLLDSNVFVIEQDGHCLIIDAGVEIEIVKRTIGNNIVDGILLTHGHYDHSLYSEIYANYFNVNIFASTKIKETLSDGEANYSDNQFIETDFSNFVFIDKDCNLKIGKFDVDCFIAEGHSPCCVCYKIDGNLFTGDVLFEKGIGRTDLINSNKKAMIETLNKLESLSFDKVYSGHGGESDNGLQRKNIEIFKKFLTR